MNELFAEPALPKTRIQRNTWTEEQIAILIQKGSWYTNRGKRVPWRKIAAVTGHHESSCALKYHTLRSRAADLAARMLIDEENARKEKMKPPAVKSVPIPARVINPEHSRGGSTFRLLMDSEIRSRIADQGVTRGLLGDPLPGRSALDKRRAGILDEAPPTDYRRAYEQRRPRITLATGPLR